MPLYKAVNRHATEIIEGLAAAPLYRKFGYVHARYAKPGEKVTTILSDGFTETTNLTRRGDWVVINPSGETLVVPGDKFRLRYEKIEEGGVYAAKGFIKAIRNPFGVAIEIQSAWGFPEKGAADCYIADGMSEDGQPLGEPYIIAGNIFEMTYSVYEETV